jgi:hypothetical protein
MTFRYFIFHCGILIKKTERRKSQPRKKKKIFRKKSHSLIGYMSCDCRSFVVFFLMNVTSDDANHYKKKPKKDISYLLKLKTHFYKLTYIGFKLSFQEIYLKECFLSHEIAA